MKSQNKFSGVFTALVTPFSKGELDHASFLKLLEQQVLSGVDGFVINGTTGESPTLEVKEVCQLVEWAKAHTKLPIIIGAGLNSTAKTVELVRELNGLKPQGFLSVVPYYNRPPQRGLVKHFSQIADVANAPVILYNVPSRTVAKLDVETIGELAKHPNIQGIKDATGDLEVFRQIRERVPAAFSLLSGDDGSCVEFVRQGGHGVISVCSHIIAGELKAMMIAKDVSGFQKFSELMKHLYIEANPIPVKMALHWMNLIASPELRLPLMALDEKFHKDFKTCLKNLKKI